MFCYPLITYVLICLVVFIQYPRYSLTSLNMIGNLIQIILLYYLCSIGWKRTAWGIVLIPVIVTVMFFRDFNDYARSFEENNKNKKNK
jgi:hypothetical protein